MPNLLAVYNNDNLVNEVIRIISRMPDWTIYLHDLSASNHDLFMDNYSRYDMHFILFINNLERNVLQSISSGNGFFPLTYKIYYSSTLKNEQFMSVYEKGINCCIIGDYREAYLAETLQNFWTHHWKRIPYTLFSQDVDLNSPRARKILKFIENMPLSNCYTHFIAEYLNISEGHFRNEFRKIFKQSFKNFKSRLISHYEIILLFEKKLKPNQIFLVLDYMNLSAFSRSFKSRHGVSWAQMKNPLVKELIQENKNNTENSKKNSAAVSKKADPSPKYKLIL